VDLALFIKSRLEELELEQKDLAASAQVTESYISQLLARKKVPPSAGRTEIYARMSRFLRLPEDELLKLANLQRRERLKKILAEQPTPLYAQCRDLVLAKCAAGRRREVRVIFERESFGELERLVTQKLLDLAKTITRDHLRDEERLKTMAHLTGQTPDQVREHSRRFVESEAFQVSEEICAASLRVLIESWDVDLKTFRIDVIPNRKLVPGGRKRFEFTEVGPDPLPAVEPGLQEFLSNEGMSGDATAEELAFLKALKFNGRRPTHLYYYRELQNLRDPLNFGDPLPLRPSKRKKG
jgi:transcriptional regulator with XRE-family HTH domain